MNKITNVKAKEVFLKDLDRVSTDLLTCMYDMQHLPANLEAFGVKTTEQFDCAFASLYGELQTLAAKFSLFEQNQEWRQK